MSLELLAIDLGKQSFHLYGIDGDGVVVSRKVSRARLAEAVAALVPAVIAMEASASAHHWGRLFNSAGSEVRLINPRFVKPFVKGSKNDATDAEAIFEAAMRPTMRFVPVKSTEQQDLQSLHRVRERLVSQRTALINHSRGLFAEYGIVLPQGPWRFVSQAPAAITEAGLSDLTRELFFELLDQLDDVNRRIGKLDARIVAICRSHAACRRLAKLPGVGPIIATALVAAVDDGRHFRSGRELAAWIGAETIYDQAASRGLEGSAAVQTTPEAPDDPRRSSGGQSSVEARRPEVTMAESTGGQTRHQPGHCRARQQDGADRLGAARTE